MLGLKIITNKKYQQLKDGLNESLGNYLLEFLKRIASELIIKKLKSKLSFYESKEFRKQELERFFEISRENGCTIQNNPELWKEYQSYFQKNSCETKKDLQKDKNQQSLLNSVKEVLDWYNNKDLKFTPETQTEVKDMFLNLHISYNNVSNTEETTQTA